MPTVMRRQRASIATGAALLMVILGIWGINAINAVANPDHFYRCVAYPLGLYKDPKCLERVFDGQYKRIASEEGTAVPYAGTQTSNHVITWTQAGVKATVTCKTAATSGSMENPSGGGAGEDHEEQIKFGECTVAAGGLKCSITGGGFTTNKLQGSTVAGPAVELKSESGPIAEIKIEGCALAGSYQLAGTAVGAFNDEASAIEFTSTSGSSLTVATHAATFTGSDQLSSEETAIFVE